VRYEKYPIAHHFVGLDEETDGDIYLYNDTTIPTIGKKNMKAYLEKIAILMKLDVY
jgi:hypothetical protein